MAELTPAEELRELIREAHGLLKDLRAERRAITELLDGIPARVEAHIGEQLAAGLAGLGKALKKAMDDSVEKVSREFDRLEGFFLGTSPAARRAGKPSLEDLIQRGAPERGDRG